MEGILQRVYNAAMVWAWLFGGWTELIGKAGELLGVASLLRERNVEKARVKAEIVKAHRELMTHLRAVVPFDVLCDRGRDTALCPRTEQETHAVRLLLVHFSWALGEHRAGRYDLPEKMDEDVRDFFSAPVTRDAWQHLKRFHDTRVVDFVDHALAEMR